MQSNAAWLSVCWMLDWKITNALFPVFLLTRRSAEGRQGRAAALDVVEQMQKGKTRNLRVLLTGGRSRSVSRGSNERLTGMPLTKVRSKRERSAHDGLLKAKLELEIHDGSLSEGRE